MSGRARTILVLFVGAVSVLVGCRREGRGARLALTEAVPPTGFVWSGALGPRSVDIVAGLWARDSVRLVVRPEPDSLPPLASEPFVISGTGRVVRARLDGLTPGARYAYAFEAGGAAQQERADASGEFGFFQVPGGAYQLSVYVPGEGATIDIVEGEPQVVTWGAIRTTPDDETPQRLQIIYEDLKALLQEHKPDAAAIEETSASPSTSGSTR